MSWLVCYYADYLQEDKTPMPNQLSHTCCCIPWTLFCRWRNFDSAHLNEMPDVPVSKERGYIPQYTVAGQHVHYRMSEGNDDDGVLLEGVDISSSASSPHDSGTGVCLPMHISCKLPAVSTKYRSSMPGVLCSKQMNLVAV